MSNLSISASSTNYASDASNEASSTISSESSPNVSQKRQSQDLSGVADSGFVSRQRNSSGSHVSSTTKSDSGSSTGMHSPPNTNGGSNSSNRVRKNPFPKRRLTADEEIFKLQKSTDFVIPRAPFQRIVRDIVREINPELLVQKQAYDALQESSEMYLVQTFQDALLLTEHRRCVTVAPKDLKLVQRMQTPELRYRPIESNNNINNATNAIGSDEENDENDESDKSE